MKVECRSLTDANRFIRSFTKFLERSRFTAEIDMKQRLKRLNGKVQTVFCVVLHPVRLREAKHYCGHHAGPCRLGGGSHKKARYLEGADWVAFNHMINDCLDRHNMIADVRSSVVIVRKGARRRMDYYSADGFTFDRDTDNYADYRRKKSPEPEYTPGTPGIATWRRKRNRKLVAA